MTQLIVRSNDQNVVSIFNRNGPSPIVVVCEHASNYIPEEYNDLGLSADALKSHVAWDPGAKLVSQHLSKLLDCPLITSEVSRLVYDCNRPPEAESAMPMKSEIFDVPGNANLSPAQKTERVSNFYEPFRAMTADVISDVGAEAVLVTIHSFTPVYSGEPRDVELGILHDLDSRLADAVMALAPQFTSMNVMYNEPYGVSDGVTHTLKLHGVANNILNVMIEIRNDLLQSQEQAHSVAIMLSGLLTGALSKLQTVNPATGHAT